MNRVVWENVKSLAGAILIYLVIKTLFVEAFRIPSGSMIPTLMVGDWLFVNKMAYGPHIPFTHSSLPGYHTPVHQDVVVFESPYQADNAPDFTPTLVKRLIGLPGDTLYMRGGVLYINGLEQHQGFGADKNYKGNPDATDPDFDWQHTIEVKTSRFGAPPAAADARQLGAAAHPARSLLDDGRQPVLLEGQPVLGRGAARESARAAAVRVLLVSCQG